MGKLRKALLVLALVAVAGAATSLSALQGGELGSLAPAWGEFGMDTGGGWGLAMIGTCSGLGVYWSAFAFCPTCWGPAAAGAGACALAGWA